MVLKFHVNNYIRKIKSKFNAQYKEIFPYKNYYDNESKNELMDDIDKGKNIVLNSREQLIGQLDTYISNVIFLRDKSLIEYSLDEFHKLLNEMSVQKLFFEASLIELNLNQENKFNHITHSIYINQLDKINNVFTGLIFVLLRQNILSKPNNINKSENTNLIKKLSSKDIINENFFLDCILIAFSIKDHQKRNNFLSKIHCSKKENNLEINNNYLVNKFINIDKNFSSKILNIFRKNYNQSNTYFIDYLNEYLNKKTYSEITLIFLEFLYFNEPLIFIEIINRIDSNLLIENLFELKFHNLLKQVLRLTLKNHNVEFQKYITNQIDYYSFYSRNTSDDISFLSNLQINERLLSSYIQETEQKTYNKKSKIYIFGQVRSNNTLNKLVNVLSQIEIIEDVTLLSWPKVNPRYPNNFQEIKKIHSELSEERFNSLMNEYKLTLDSSSCFEKNVIPDFLLLDSDLKLDNKNIEIILENEDDLFINNLQLNEMGCPQHIKNQLRFLFLFHKCLEDISKNKRNTEIYFFTRPDFSPGPNFNNIFDKMFNDIINDSDLLVCDSELNCLKVKLGGIGDRFFGIHASKINQIKEKLDKYLSELFQILFNKETCINKEYIKLNYDIFGAHHFIQYIFFSIGLKEKHFFDLPFKLSRRIYSESEIREIMEISSNLK